MSLAFDERTATRVGAAALVGGLAAAVFVVAILPRLALSDAVHVRVYYLELAGLREGAPVRSAGAVIGRVAAISFAPASAGGRGSDEGRGSDDGRGSDGGDGGYGRGAGGSDGGAGGSRGPLGGQAGAVVHLALDADHLDRAWRDGDYVISSRGPLSSRYIEILPPRPGPSAGPVSEGAELRGVDPPTLDRVLSRAWQNLVIARRFAEAVGPEARQLVAEVSALLATWRALSGAAAGSPGAGGAGDAAPLPLEELLARFAELRDEAERSWREVLGGRPGVDRALALWARTQALTRRTAAVADELVAALEALGADVARLRTRLGASAPGERLAQLIEQLRGLSDKLDAVTASVRVVAARWQRREGTLGRLLTDPEFPEDAKELGKILKRQPWRIFGHPDDSRRGGDAAAPEADGGGIHNEGAPRHE